jgi:hypothetical protein
MITNSWEYIEAGFSGFMRNSNLIHSDLSGSGNFFTLVTKRTGLGGLLAHRSIKSSGKFRKLTHGHCSYLFGLTEV